MRFIGCKTLLLDNIKQVIDENATMQNLSAIFSRALQQWQDTSKNGMKFIQTTYCTFLMYFREVLFKTIMCHCLKN